jgi:uncharacterized protein YjaG (DUF416 family)
MAILRFDEEELVRRLQLLSPAFRVAFAAACAERQLPAYLVFYAAAKRGDPHALAEILSRLWDDLTSNPMPHSEVEGALEVCMSLIPREDEGLWINEQAYAEDAAAAVAYALRTRLTENAQESAWAARRAYEAVDHFVIDQLGLSPKTPEEEEQVASHPLVQTELIRQDRDLKHLESARGAISVGFLASAVRARAQQEARTFLSRT